MTLQLVDGVYEALVDDSPHICNALTAAGGPLYPPDEWFRDPGFSRPTPITVTADGKISGHIAPWDASHIGLPPGTKPPRSSCDYAFFRTGLLQTDKGKEVPVGQITLAGGHAPLNADAGQAVKHYDDTASAVADVVAGEDQHGIWVSGGLRPSVTEEQVRALRASAPSGDWRPINNGLELVAVCQVNTPGFPVARAMVAGGQVTALVASGAAAMFELQRESGVMDALQSVAARVADLESVVAGGAKRSTGSSPEYVPAPKKRLFPEPAGEEPQAVTAAAPAAGPDYINVTLDDGRNVLYMLTPVDTVASSTDSVDTSGVNQDGLGVDSQAKRQPKPSLAEQGVMPDAGNNAMKTEDQGPNGSRMDGDGDFDGDPDGDVPVVDASYDDDNTDDLNFDHSPDACPDGCTNPAHSKGRENGGITAMSAAANAILAVTAAGKTQQQMHDELVKKGLSPKQAAAFAAQAAKREAANSSDSGDDETPDAGDGSDDADNAPPSGRLAGARKKAMMAKMDRYKKAS